MIPAIVKILSSIPGIISGVEAILKIFTKYFPPKSEGERAVDKYKDQVKQIKETNLELNKKIKEAQRGRTKAIEDILNRPR